MSSVRGAPYRRTLLNSSRRSIDASSLMLSSIVGFHQDEHGDWVAELACGHGQHMRHRPPWLIREWVASAEGRAAKLGQAIDCPLCDVSGKAPAAGA